MSCKQKTDKLFKTVFYVIIYDFGNGVVEISTFVTFWYENGFLESVDMSWLVDSQNGSEKNGKNNDLQTWCVGFEYAVFQELNKSIFKLSWKIENNTKAS